MRPSPFSKPRHTKQQNSLFVEREGAAKAKPMGMPKASMFTSISVAPSTRLKGDTSDVRSSLDDISAAYLPHLRNKAQAFQDKSRSTKPAMRGEGNQRSPNSPSYRFSAPGSDQVTASNRFTASHRKHFEKYPVQPCQLLSRFNLGSLNRNNPGKLVSNPSMPTMVTDKSLSQVGLGVPYKDGSFSKAAVGALSRNHSNMKSDSDEKLEEWSHIFNLQHNRWQEEFDDVKAQFLTDFEKQKLQRSKHELPKAKPRTTFELPNDYLPLQKRTVRAGEAGTKERLRRDKLHARRLRRQGNSSNDEEVEAGEAHLQHDSSVLTVQQRSVSTLEMGKQPKYQSQRDVNSTFEATHSLNESTSLGRIMYSKEERQAQSKIKLPSIHQKSLKILQKNILSSSESAQKLLSASAGVISAVKESAHLSSNRHQNSTSQGALSGGMEDRVRASALMNIQDSVSRDNGSQMRIQVNRSSSVEQTPQQLGEEIKSLFKSNPDGNPFQIMYDRNKFDAVNATQQRKQQIHHLTQQTRAAEQAYLDQAIRRSVGSQSPQKLAETINLNVNLTINHHYGAPTPSKNQESSFGMVPHVSMQDLMQQVQVNPSFNSLTPSKQYGNSTQSLLDSQEASEAEGDIKTRGRKIGVKSGLYSRTEEQSKRVQNQIRISKRKLLEPLKIASKFGALTQTKQKKAYFLDYQNKETLLSLKDKMGDQQIQIGHVRKFIDKQIDNEIQREKIKKSLAALQKQLIDNKMTLREIVDQHTSQLLAKANFQDVDVPDRLGAAGEQSRARFINTTSGFDFVRILECTSSLKPLIKFQRALKQRSKRRHQKRLAEKAARKASSVNPSEQDSDSDGGDTPMKHLKKKLPAFSDQDQSIAYFIENIKKLIFLSRESTHQAMGEGKAKEDELSSDFEWVEEPEMYASSSGESKYSNEDRQMKDHLATGQVALANSVRKFKNADKIIQKNQVMGQADMTSHLVHYLDAINKKGHIPKGFGLVHRNSKPNEINAAQTLLTDAHASAIAQSVSRAKFVNKLILRNVGLKDDQAIAIVRNMDKQVVHHLDVSYNPLLTKRFYNELNQLLSDETCNLERVEIEGNKVGDAVLHDLCEALIAGKHIVYLNVSHNRITDAGARDLALLIQEAPKLRLLFMTYNKVMGFGGVEIAEAIGVTKSLQVLDISFNSICGSGLTKKKEEMTEEEKQKKEDEKKSKKNKKQPKITFQEGTKPAAKGFADLFAQGFSENWSSAFAQNKSLLHVDMSHNHLNLTDVEIISEGLKENQQILGIHFAGNEGDVDTQGFVKPALALSAAHDSVFSRMQDGLQGGVVKDSNALGLKKTSNCWVCEGWSEHRFTYEPGRSDDNPNHDEFKPIKLHLDVDHFEGDLMMDAGNKKYEVYRMLPPGPHRYFFSVDGKVSVAQDQRTTSQQLKQEKKLYLDMSKVQAIIEEQVKNSQNSTAQNSPKKNTPKGNKGLRAKEPEPEAEPLPDYYNLELPKVNYIENIAQNSCVFSREQIERMNCVPRPGPKGLGNRNKLRTPWDFSLSVFASYKPDTARLLNDCFEMDWKRTKVARIVKDEEEREKLKTYVRSIYKWFREMYKFTAGSDPMNDIFCIGTNVFSDLATQGTKGLVDNKTLKMADLDFERISTNANEQNSKYNPKDRMVRHNFLEVFFRLSDTKYLKRGAGGPEINTPELAFKTMFEKDLFPLFKQYDSHHWRKTVLWQEDVDFVLKQSLEPLKSLYKRFVGRNSLPGGQQYMSFSEFTDLITNSNCFSDNFGQKQIGNQFNLSMMSQVDEVEKDRHLNMTFVEFLEAVVRVAEKTEIPHCILDEFVWGEDEIAPDMRETYGRRDLVIKLEALILFLIRGNLSMFVYQKHLKTLESFKEAGLYANDLDTGSFALNAKRA